jgi:activating signal cointegrator 1
MNNIKVLTLWEPWATLFVYDEKGFETRPRAIGIRPMYLIHAAAKMSKMQKDICQTEPFTSALAICGIKDYKDFKLGHIIGKYDHMDCHHIIELNGGRVGYEYPEPLLTSSQEFEIVSEKEQAFGDWREGRFAWDGKNKKVFDDPLPYKNGQGYYQSFKGDVNWLIKQVVVSE